MRRTSAVIDEKSCSTLAVFQGPCNHKPSTMQLTLRKPALRHAFVVSRGHPGTSFRTSSCPCLACLLRMRQYLYCRIKGWSQSFAEDLLQKTEQQVGGGTAPQARQWAGSQAYLQVKWHLKGLRIEIRAHSVAVSSLFASLLSFHAGFNAAKPQAKTRIMRKQTSS